MSQGGQLVYVPEVTGKNIQEVEIILSRAGLAVGNIADVYRDDIKRDIIAAQDPASGSIVKPGTLVDLAVSNGPASLMGFLVMPYMVGKSSVEAVNMIEETGFEVSEQETVLNENVSPGTVIKQEPAPGEMLTRDSYIKLFVSQLSPQERLKRTGYIFYEVPQDIMARHVKIVVKDAVSRRTVYEKLEAPGNKISFEVEIIGKAYVLYFLDDVPVKRNDL